MTTLLFDSNALYQPTKHQAVLNMLSPQKSIKKQDFTTAKILAHKTQQLQQTYPFLSKNHSGGYAATLHSTLKMGLDLEIQKPRNINAHLELCCNAFERHYITQSQNIMLTFYQIWTLKEAILKLYDLKLDSIKNVGLSENGAFGTTKDPIVFKHLNIKNLLITLAWNPNPFML